MSVHMGGGVPDTRGVLDPDGSVERVAAWKGRIDKLAADTKIMSDRLQELRVTVDDGKGLAKVTVDSSGGLVDLRLGQRIQRIAPDVVARTIMNTIREAKIRLAERSQEIIADTVGTETAAARAIAEHVDQRLRPPERGIGSPDGMPGRW